MNADRLKDLDERITTSPFAQSTPQFGQPLGAMHAAQESLYPLSTRILVLDPDGTIIGDNWPHEQPEGPHADWPDVPSELGASYLNACRRAAALGDGAALRAVSRISDVLRGSAPRRRMEYHRHTAHGLRWFLMTVSSLARGQGVMVTHEDITARRRAQGARDGCRLPSEQPVETPSDVVSVRAAASHDGAARRLKVESRLHQHCEASTCAAEAIAIADATRRIVMVNHAFCLVTGYSGDEVVGREIGAPLAEDLDPDWREVIWRTVETTGKWQGELLSRRKDGQDYPAFVTIDAVGDHQGRVKNYVFSAADIASIKEAQNHLHYLAHHDCLTGLANRLLFTARLEQSIAYARRHHGCVALLFVDLDDFKQVNDTLGHAAGDEVLKTIATRLQSQVRREDTVARLGGDEFAVLVEAISEPEDAIAIAQKLQAIIGEPLEIDGEPLRVTASIGIGLCPDDGDTLDDLFKVADNAMYQAKRSRQRGLVAVR